MSRVEDDCGGESCSSHDARQVPKQRLDLPAMERDCPASVSSPEQNHFSKPQALLISEDQIHGPIFSLVGGKHDPVALGASSCEGGGSPSDTKKRTRTIPCLKDVDSPSIGKCEHLPTSLPSFRDPSDGMWTASHAANCPSEDRSSSLVNVLLRPLPRNPSKDADNRVLIRLSLWSVIDGHGGGCVATYASEVLLPHIAASVARALKCSIVDRGICTVNGELRDANALDLDGLIRTSGRSRENPNSIQYRSPSEGEESEDNAGDADELAHLEDDTVAHLLNDQDDSAPSMGPENSVASPLLPSDDEVLSVSSVKTSVKTAASHRLDEAPVGTHSPGEVANITRAITESFLAVDEGWINSIDPIATHQTQCQTNGRWNAGACALVVFTIQRLDWTSTAIECTKVGTRDTDARDDTSHNKDAARRRMLDFESKGKCPSSVSTISSASSLTADDPGGSYACESEITETDDDDEASDHGESIRKPRVRSSVSPRQFTHGTISTLGGCKCHAYQAREVMLYTAHVGDCRAVLLGRAPPRTIKVCPGGSVDHPDTTDDESSHHSSDETEGLSSSDHDAESSDEDDIDSEQDRVSNTSPPYLNYLRRPSRRCRRSPRDLGNHAPFIALPPLRGNLSSGGSESDTSECEPSPLPRIDGQSRSRSPVEETSSAETRDLPPPLDLVPFTRPIDLTTDHSAYNPAEVTAVLRRCNNAPRAISASAGGGIKRVAGSLAVTRALGDAYLKTPLLSFNPYKRHAPYITARPEVNCRLLARDGDRILILASDGVWERCSGEDVLRWVKNFSVERLAQMERRNRGRRGSQTDRFHYDGNDGNLSPQEDLFANDYDADLDVAVGQKRGRLSPVSTNKKRKLKRVRRATTPQNVSSTVADVVVRRVLNKVRRARNMSSLQALMSLPKGRARRSKHDDITTSVVDLQSFVS